MNKKYIDREEALRFMSFKGEPDGELLCRIEKSEREVARLAVPAYTYKVFAVPEISHVLQGDDIKKHLAGCSSVIVFAATLGAEVDKYIKRCQVTDIASAMIADAVASAFIEKYCMECDECLAENFSPSYLTWRFSPGYGDFPIELQGEILRLADAERRLGLFATESSMLVPFKSVTAIIGVSAFSVSKENQNCATCHIKDTCVFRKEGDHCGCQSTSE